MNECSCRQTTAALYILDWKVIVFTSDRNNVFKYTQHQKSDWQYCTSTAITSNVWHYIWSWKTFNVITVLAQCRPSDFCASLYYTTICNIDCHYSFAHQSYALPLSGWAIAAYTLRVSINILESQVFFFICSVYIFVRIDISLSHGSPLDIESIWHSERFWQTHWIISVQVANNVCSQSWIRGAGIVAYVSDVLFIVW